MTPTVVWTHEKDMRSAVFLRAELRATLYGALTVVQHYGRFGAALLMVVLFGVSVWNICLGWILFGAIIVPMLLFRLLYQGQLSPRRFSRSFLKTAVIYGFPMIWTELSNVILDIGDRYIIDYFMGQKAVGVYSVGYSTASLGHSLLTVPLRMAVVPMCLAVWSKSGPEETRQFLQRAMRGS